VVDRSNIAGVRPFANGRGVASAHFGQFVGTQTTQLLGELKPRNDTFTLVP
jgi:hypothetical protein